MLHVSYCVCMCVCACSAQEQLDLVCTSGRPFCLLDVRLMGPEGKPLQPGSTQVGEVQCRGPTVFKGYWQLPQASVEAFSDGWFCTGDLATVNKAGYITVVDRIKDMILHGQLLPPIRFLSLPPCLTPSCPVVVSQGPDRIFLITVKPQKPCDSTAGNSQVRSGQHKAGQDNSCISLHSDNWTPHMNDASPVTPCNQT